MFRSQRLCKFCGVEFTANNPNSWHCSVRCRLVETTELDPDTYCVNRTSSLHSESGRAMIHMEPGRSNYASIVSYEEFVEPILQDGDQKLEVCHTCHNPRCINPKHLYLGTHKDNMNDRDYAGRHHDCKGTKNSRAKLSEHHVRKIRGFWDKNKTLSRKSRYTIPELAKAFGVSEGCIQGIVYQRNWVGV